ncbi:MAG: hypothetical protein HY565_03985, partial [Candidatus Kerfeldbacteria bacterium]|nr:hypothetical protein [Candidatus Kerfeldbacteria bacterium]
APHPAALATLPLAQRERIKQKIGRGYFYFLAQRRVEQAGLASGQVESQPTTQEKTTMERFQAIIELPEDERSTALFDLVRRYGAEYIPDALLDQLGYEKYKIRGKKGQSDTFGIRGVRR